MLQPSATPLALAMQQILHLKCVPSSTEETSKCSIREILHQFIKKKYLMLNLHQVISKEKDDGDFCFLSTQTTRVALAATSLEEVWSSTVNKAKLGLCIWKVSSLSSNTGRTLDLKKTSVAFSNLYYSHKEAKMASVYKVMNYCIQYYTNILFCFFVRHQRIIKQFRAD